MNIEIHRLPRTGDAIEYVVMTKGYKTTFRISPLQAATSEENFIKEVAYQSMRAIRQLLIEVKFK